MMDQLKLAQFDNTCDKSKEKKREILKKVDVRYCIPEGVDNQMSCYAGYTSLHFAVKSSIVDLDLINNLLEQDSDLFKQGTHDGNTPIHLAFNNHFYSHIMDKETCLQKHSLINTLLFKQVEMKNILNPCSLDGINHFHIACAANHVVAVEFLAKAEENVNQHIINSDTRTLSGYTPLHCAIKYSSIEAAEILLQHGADIHLKDAEGMSCVHLLIDRILDVTDFITMGERTLCEPHEEEIERIESIIKLVLKARASDKVFMDDTGLSALHVACVLRDKFIVEDFLKQDLDVNLPVKSESKYWSGWTPLHFAACFNIKTMILLMQCGADITIKNSKGESALDLCAKRLAPSDIQKVLSAKNEFKNIALFDSSTKLMVLLLAMDNYEIFSNFLRKLENINVTVPLNSPIWPGYNLLHLSVSLNEKTKCRSLEVDLNSTANKKANSERYNCTEDEQALYSKRIDLLLEYGCSTSTKNANGQTPIHLAFGMLSQNTLEKLLRCDMENTVDQNGMTHLHISCALGQLDAVERYVRGGADVNSRTGVGFYWMRKWKDQRVRANSTPLHVAVLYQYDYIVKYLLASSADFYITDSLGFTPVHLSMIPHVDCLARLLLDAALPNLRDSMSAAGLSHLHVASWAGHRKAVKQLLLGGADIDHLIGEDVEDSVFWAGKTPLHLALVWDRLRVVEALLRAGANVYVENVNRESTLRDAVLYGTGYRSSQYLIRVLKACAERHDDESAGMTLLHVACASCDVKWAKRLLEQGANVDARIRGGRLDGATPLHLILEGIDRGDDDQTYKPREGYALVDLLVSHGADVTIEWRGSTPICLIYRDVLDADERRQFNDEDEVELVLRTADLLLNNQESYGVNPVDEHGFSHFHFACVRDNVEVATAFLDHGVDVNRPTDPFDYNRGGFTPLHFAMAHKSTEVAYLLLERGADVHAEDARGNTPLHVAFENEFVNLPLIKAMMRLGADVRADNLRGSTLLHLLMRRLKDWSPEVYLNVIESVGLDGCLYQRDMNGNTPLHLALKFDNFAAMKALFRIGVNINVVDLEKNVSERMYQLIQKLKGLDTFNLWPIEAHLVNVSKVLACYIWKMKFVRLDVTKSNSKYLESVEEQFSLANSLEQPCQDELEKAGRTQICEGVTVKDFLSELEAAAAYPRMHPIQRAIIDKYFKCTADLRREFPEFSGLLLLQYRKAVVALVRLELTQPAKESITSILQVELPELCLEAILKYFTNDEMKIVIEVAQELFV